MKDNMTGVRPFKAMKITATVDWDVDRGDGPDPEFKAEIPYSRLVDAEVIDPGDVDETCVWLDEDELEDFISEYLSNDAGYCHTGFAFDYELVY